MAGSKVVQFFLLISMMIFSTHALRLLLTEGKRGRFELETDIKFLVDDNGIRQYDGYVANTKTFTPVNKTKLVIVYIKDLEELKATTLDAAYRANIVQLGKNLKRHEYQLLFLGVSEFDPRNTGLIGSFLFQSINMTLDKIHTIGEGDFDVVFDTLMGNLTQYKEIYTVYRKDLRGRIRSISA